MEWVGIDTRTPFRRNETRDGSRAANVVCCGGRPWGAGRSGAGKP